MRLLEAENCASQLFALDSHSAAGLQLRGRIRYSRGLIQDAVNDLKAALDIESNNADTLLLLSNCYLISGYVTSARPLLRRLCALDPMTPVTRCMPAFADIMEGRFDQAIEPYRQMYEMDRTNPMAHMFYVWVLVLNRRIDEAAAIDRGLPAELRETVPGRVASFLCLAAAGRPLDARAALTQAIDATAGATAGATDARFNDLLEIARNRWKGFVACATASSVRCSTFTHTSIVFIVLHC